MTPSISVVIVTRDRPQSLLRCLAAIEEGDRQPDEVVVVDQSSAAGATERELVGGASLRVRHVHIAPSGVSAARNLGAGNARSDWLAFTDDDCVPSGRWLAALIDACRTDDANAATGSVLPLVDGARLVAVSSRTDPNRRVFTAESGAPPWAVGTGGNLLLTRELFDRTGGFDIRFGPGGRYRAAEDIELLDRMIGLHAKIVYEPEAVVYHEMKTQTERLLRRYPYGYGMGALLTRRRGRGSLILAAHYARIQAHAFLRGASRLSPRETAEPLLSVAGFTAGAFRGFLDARSARSRARSSR
jgi:GT2 family glycosyltransferase